MSAHSGFYIPVHVDRFSDLSSVIGDLKVHLELESIDENSTVEVFISGADPEVVRKLDGVLWNIQHILKVAPAVEGV